MRIVKNIVAPAEDIQAPRAIREEREDRHKEKEDAQQEDTKRKAESRYRIPTDAMARVRQINKSLSAAESTRRKV